MVGSEGQYVAVGDINGDGFPDVVVPDRFNFVSVSLGRKGRVFPSAFSLTPQWAGWSSVGDINGDGLLEIFVGATVYRNLGNGNFEWAAYTDPNGYMIADLTGKGVVDLLASDGTNQYVLPNDGTFGFSTSSPIALPSMTAPGIVKDMDGDGNPDIVCNGQILFGIGQYQFTAVALPGIQAPFVVGDFNGT